MSPRIFPFPAFVFSIANLWAILTANGQYGQVGVTKINILTSLSIFETSSLLSCIKSVSPLLTSTISSRNAANSCPAGIPKYLTPKSFPSWVIVVAGALSILYFSASSFPSGVSKSTIS
ncbi:118aa long hypothetical protein [Pyrococcus horikoshii OT3]|uniref:Uncharacterized protein n=1 Tax=Pyrococcus horikoshii (strain ATCC 700860 / DSM 12428 / JCM 9974 / NBRC 100139 / OT-3) TaxID=70601 RepID=O57918_PYRHO|nr:118aa long hypothetical protein [Pyrococcus horikoshii OT3]